MKLNTFFGRFAAISLALAAPLVATAAETVTKETIDNPYGLSALWQQGDVEEARVFCQRGMQLAIETANTWTLADGQRIMASICLRQGEYTDAREWAEKASAHFVEIGDSTNAAVALRVAAEVAEQEGDAERARSLLERARSLSDATPLTG